VSHPVSPSHPHHPRSRPPNKNGPPSSCATFCAGRSRAGPGHYFRLARRRPYGYAPNVNIARSRAKQSPIGNCFYISWTPFLSADSQGRRSRVYIFSLKALSQAQVSLRKVSSRVWYNWSSRCHVHRQLNRERERERETASSGCRVGERSWRGGGEKRPLRDERVDERRLMLTV
jgi:hypothetical protein